MNQLEISRNEISKIDAQMAKLFEKRMEESSKIAEYKKNFGLSVRDFAREAKILESVKSNISNGEIDSYYVQFLKNVIDLSCKYQTKIMEGMRVSYSGVEGAYGYIAANKMFPGSHLAPYSDFVQAYRSVENGEADCAVLPLENSYAGEVGTVMDLIFSGSLYINQVIDLPISHCLIAAPGATKESIKTVISHPQALSQCDEYIRKNQYQTITNSNTAIAAKGLQNSNDLTLAAIASEETAKIFGLEILDKDINDSKNNITRFAAFSPAQNRPNTQERRDDENFILVFTVKNEAGSLAQMLDIIGMHGYNMRSLRSRPMKGLQWNYYFYIEAEGNINNENGHDLLRELSPLCAKMRLAGTYFVNNISEG